LNFELPDSNEPIPNGCAWSFIVDPLEIGSGVNYLNAAANSKSAELLFQRRDNSKMPEVGDMAPDFELPSNLEKGKKVKLSDFRGKNNVVLAFYPLAWTPV
jgi:hypothetical protein